MRMDDYIGWYFVHCHKNTFTDKKISEYLGVIVDVNQGFWLVKVDDPQGMTTFHQFGVCAGAVTQSLEDAEEYLDRCKAELQAEEGDL